MPKKKTTIDKKAKDKPYPPAYFMSLTLENIRCFGEKQTLDLSDGKGHPAQWTVILGDNGVGKTTLLQCLTILEPRIEPRIKYGREEQPSYALPHYPVRFKSLDFKDSLLRDKAQEGKISSNLYIGMKLSKKQNGKEIKGCRLNIKGNTFGTESVNSDVFGLKCYGYGATRTMGSASLSVNERPERNESLFVDYSLLYNVEELLLRADYAAIKKTNEGESNSSSQSDIDFLIINLLPDVSAKRIWFSAKLSPEPRLDFETPYGWVRFKELSFGYKTMVAWILDLALRMYERYPDSKDPLAEPAVVLVDEIDLHMHPKWQRKIMSYLTVRFPNTQFIVTAHSPLIVQAATDANVVLLKREGDHVVIENDPEIVKGWRVDQILTSDLYGLDSSRSPEIQKLLDERSAILTKPKLTKTDIKKVEKLEAQIGYLPTGETREDRNASEIIHQAAEFLQKQKKGKLDKVK